MASSNGEGTMDKASRTIVSVGKTNEEKKEAAIAMFRAIAGREPSQVEMQALDAKVAKVANDPENKPKV